MHKWMLVLCSFTGFAWAEINPLTLEQALELARQSSPRLKAAGLETRAAEQKSDAAGLWKNPELEIEAEGIGGDRGGTAESEVSVVLKQTIRRGDKRTLERQVAGRAVDVVRQSRAEEELQLLSDVRCAFIEVRAQQEIGRVRAEQEQLGRAMVEVARRRQAAGGGSALDVIRAEMELEEVLLSQSCCFGDLEAARIRLASLIGVPEPEMGEPSGYFYGLEEPGGVQLSAAHPALQKMDARIEMLRAEAARVRASDAADLTLGAGMKHEAAEDLTSFVFSASIPLNFVRGGRAEALAEMTRAEALVAGREELRRELQQQLSQRLAIYRGAKTEAEMIEQRLLPKAGQACEAVQAGYDAGRFSWIEQIDAQHRLAEIRIRHIEALRDARRAEAEISKFMREDLK